MNTWRLMNGDVREQLRLLVDGSVQTCVTSPPYWGLRDYGQAGQLGLEPTPELYTAALVDVFTEVRRVLRDDGTLWLNLGDCYATGAGSVGNCPGGGDQGARWAGDVNRIRDDKRGYRGDRLVNTNSGNVARPKTRALRDGTHAGKNTAMAAKGPMTQPNRMPIHGLKPKDMVGIPWRVAFALQADGWYLRAAMPWLKRNGMPESAMDRPTTTVEQFFLLTKSVDYFYDSDAVTKIGAIAAGTRAAKGSDARSELKDVNGRPPEYWEYTGTRLRRQSDWFFETFEGLLASDDGQPLALVVNTKPYSEAHFAVFPEAVVDPCVLAGSRPGDTVLDPFTGSGTTGAVALKRGRQFVGIELNPSYVQLARRRLSCAAPLFSVEAVS